MPWRHLLSLTGIFALTGCNNSVPEAPAETPMAAECRRLEGTWERVYVVVDGQKQVETEGDALRMTVRGDTYSSERAGAVMARGRHLLDPAATPKAMDIIPADGAGAGKCVHAVYALDGDELRVCWTQTGERRPTELSSEPGSRRVLAVYRRVPPVP